MVEWDRCVWNQHIYKSGSGVRGSSEISSTMSDSSKSRAAQRHLLQQLLRVDISSKSKQALVKVALLQCICHACAV